MGSEAPSPFELSFSELLHLELRRQGLRQSESLVRSMAPHISYRPGADASGGASVEMSFDGIGIGDREAMAVAEALLKLRAPALVRAHGASRWALSLRGNAITDRAVPHLELLVARAAPPLAALDLRGTRVSPGAARRLEASLAEESQRSPEESQRSPEESQRSRGRSASAGARRGIDAEALQRRRSELFKTREGVETATQSQSQDQPQQQGTAETHAARQSQGLGLQQSSIHRRSQSPAQPAIVNANVVSPSNKAEEARKESEDEWPSTPQSSIPLQRSQQASSAGCTPLSTLKREAFRTTFSRSPSASASRRASVSKEAASSFDPHPAAGSVQSAVDGYEVCSSSAPHASGSTTDAMDLTANMNSLLCNVLDLNGAVASGALRRDYGADCVWDVIAARATSGPAPFASLTVITLCRNGLTALRCALPPSLLRLDVSENELRELDGLAQCRMLTLLRAQHNRLQSMRGVEQNLAIAHLFLGHNEITVVDNIAHLIVLETLDLSHNRLRTQAAIRPLSLSGALRHVMLRGNPVMDRIKHCYRPLLRNLCPSLQCIDDDRLTFSRLAAGAHAETDRMRVTYAEKEKPFSRETESARLDVADSASYMHLLTRSVTGRTINSNSSNSNGGKSNHHNNLKPNHSGGYGDRVLAKTTARAIRSRAETEAQRRRRAAPRTSGEPLRKGLMKRLALESKRFLESVVVERLTGMLSHSASAETNRDEDSKSSVPVTSSPSAAANRRGVSSLPSPSAEGTDTAARRETTHTQRTAPVMQNGRMGAGYSMRKTGTAFTPHSAPQEATTTTTRAESRQGSDVVEVFMDDGLTAENDAVESTAPGSYAALYAATRTQRDEVLDHEQWVNLSVQRQEPRSVPFGETPKKTEGAKATGAHTCGISPIRRALDVSQENSTNSTQMLRDVRALVDHAPPPPPRVLSPVSVQAPVQAVRAAPVSRSLRHAAETKAPRRARDRMLSPPPPCASHPYGTSEKDEWESAREWALQLREDAVTVHAALRTVVGLLAAQRARLAQSAKETLPNAFVEERRACAEILRSSGMLQDTEIPADVATLFGFTAAELNETTGEDDESDESDGETVAERTGTDTEVGMGGAARERLRVLREIRMLGDGKTCLRYMVLLMEEGKERDLRRYVDEIQELLM